MDCESGELTVRRCGRSMNRQLRDIETGMRLIERIRGVDSRDKVKYAEGSDQYVRKITLMVERE